MSEAADGLAERVVRGGGFLLARQVAGAALGFGGMLVLARLLGPAPSGLYFTAFGIVFFVQNVAKLSLDVFVVRAPGRLEKAVLDQVFVMLAVSGLATTVVMVAISGSIARAIGMPELRGVLAVLSASILLMHLYRVPLARLERELAFRQIGVLELGAQAAFFFVAVCAAGAGWGAYAPAAGWLAQQLAMLVGCLAVAGYRPAFRWDRAVAADALAYGGLATSSILIQSLRPLIVPLLVGGTQGAAAVGIVSLAVRLLETLSICRTVISRMSVSLLARMADDRERLLRTLGLAIEIQTAAVAIPIAGFSLVAAQVIPAVFGPEWAGAARLVTLLSPPMIATGVFGLHGFLLMTARRPRALVVSQVAATALAWAAAAVFIPRFGYAGYAYAEIAAIAAWLVPAWLVARDFGRVRTRPALLWAAAASLTALAPLAGWGLVLALPALALHRPTRTAAAAALGFLRERVALGRAHVSRRA
jgi:O-antigen/teichoic acid export membrane protein